MLPAASGGKTTRSSLRAFPASLAFLSATAALAAGSDPTATYAALRAAKPSGNAVVVENFPLERDTFRFRFSGVFEFLAPVDGETSGAVFTGSGEWTLTPATPSERRHLAFQMRQSDLETLTDRFERLLLLFTDGTAAQIEKAGKPASPSGRAAAAVAEASRRLRRRVKTNLFLRLAADRLRKTSPSSGVFLAVVDGDRLPPAILAFDPWNVESLRLPGHLLGGAETALFVDDDQRGGYWYLEHRKEEIAARVAHAPRTLADASHYEIDITIQRNKKISAVSTVAFKPLIESLRLVPIHLLGALRIEKAELARNGTGTWVEIPFVQEDEDEDCDAAAILPAGVPGGESLHLRVHYGGGNVVEEFSRGAFFVGARTSWYPNLDVFRDLATFDLTFRVPKAFSVVAVGNPLSERIEGDLRVSTWETDRPIRVAGFNYGDFVKRENTDDDSGMTIRVFTRRNESPESWAESCEADGINSARVGTTYFGKLEDPAVSITEQIAWTFGQSWPGLIFHPDVSWLHTAGGARYQEFWEKARKAILAKPPGSEISHDAAGPISMGWRLRSRQSPGAASAILYKKGAYVLHMLRMMMREQGVENADARFIAMMTEFSSAQAGENASTADFRKIVEKHMTPAMDLGGDGTMRWFFDQWVDGTEIPRYRSDLTVSKVGDGYRVRGSVSQEGVGQEFTAAVPVYADFGKNRLARVGILRMKGASVTPVDASLKLPEMPRRIVVNALHDVLARD